MKFYETNFDDYIKINEINPIHPTIEIKNDNFADLNNTIIYGPSGVGKYTQALSLIKHYSPSQLKYEKRMVITYNKNTHYFKISDIHYEIDMSLLGCNSKLFWHDIYSQILDIISARNDKTGIILCKYFHEIHSELLENFYSYMQKMYNYCLNVKFILITQELTFIPDNILNCCQHVKIARPSRCTYNKCLKIKLTNTDDISLITNMKEIKTNSLPYLNEKKTKEAIVIVEQHKIICDTIIEKILDLNELKFINLRDILYDICIFDLNIVNCIWYIIKVLIEKGKLDKKNLNDALVETYKFLKLYNNNYRPIYHLERYILYITTIIHEI
jgi:DNA polymerase III delta prime subunit